MNGGSSAGADLLCWIRIVLYSESVPHRSWRSIVVKHPGPLKKRSLSSIYHHARAHSLSITALACGRLPSRYRVRAHAAPVSIILQTFLFRTFFFLLCTCRTCHDGPQQTDKSGDDPVINWF